MKRGASAVAVDPPLPQASRHAPPSSRAAKPLFEEVRSALKTLEALAVHQEALGETATATVLNVLHEVNRRLDRNELFVCIVGEIKAGKSTFLNALLGERVVGAAVTECTGTVTLIRRAGRVGYKVHFGNSSQDLDDAFRTREEKLKADYKEAHKQHRAYQQLAADLPAMDRAAAQDASTHRNSLPALKKQLDTDEAAKDTAQRTFAGAEAACVAFELEVRNGRKGVPFFYHHLAHWWAPWLWLPRLVAWPFCRPEWIAHLSQVRALHADKSCVAKLRADHDEAGRQVENVRCRLAEATAALSRACARIKELQQIRATLPANIAGWQSVIQRLKADCAAYLKERHQRFLVNVREFTDMKRRGGEVTLLELEHPGRLLPPGLVFIDTPGVNTNNVVNCQRAWEAIRRDADACILLSDMKQVVSESTQEFVQRVREVVPHIILILTKVDRALASADLCNGSPLEQLEETRRCAERRFAQEVGRDPSEVYSFAVAAERALVGDDPQYARRFEADMKRLFDLLDREKTLMLAARSAQAIRHCISTINDAQSYAEASYRERMAALEAQRIPDPGQFCSEQMSRIMSAVRHSAAAAIRSAVDEYDRQMAQIKEQLVTEVLRRGSAGELKDYVNGLQSRLNAIFDALGRIVREHIKYQASYALAKIESPLLEALRERYRIAQRLVGGAGNRVGGGTIDGQVGAVNTVGVDLQGSVSQFQMQRGGLFVGGAATGAVIGSFVPVIGTVFGALIGGAIGWLFGPSLDDLKADCAAKLSEALDQSDMQMRPQLVNGADGLAGSMNQALAAVLAEATQRYSGWISALIQEEQRRIAEGRRRLEHLLQIRSALEAHDKRLAVLCAAAAKESRGLCR